MTIETETILIKLLEELKADVKETNQKLDRFIDTTNQTLTNIQVNQARLEGKIDNVEGILKEKTSSLQQGQDIINTKLNTQNTWLLSLITALIVGVLGLIVTIGKVVFFPNP